MLAQYPRCQHLTLAVWRSRLEKEWTVVIAACSIYLGRGNHTTYHEEDSWSVSAFKHSSIRDSQAATNTRKF